jgi:glutamate-1-semialdehyde aminotransferase
MGHFSMENPGHFSVEINNPWSPATAYNGNPVFAHHATDAPMTDIDTDLLQLFGHAGPAVAARAQARLLFDVRQNHHIGVIWTFLRRQSE